MLAHRNIKRIALVLAALALMASCSRKQEEIPLEGRPIQSMGTYGGYDAARPPSLKNFITVDLDDNKITQEFYKDYDLTLLYVWQPDSEPSKEALANIGDLAVTYHGKGVGFLGVVTNVKEDADKELARKTAADAGATFPQMLVSNELYAGWLINVKDVPYAVFVDKNGDKVGMAQTGKKNEKIWGDLVASYLKTARENETSSESSAE